MYIYLVAIAGERGQYALGSFGGTCSNADSVSRWFSYPAWQHQVPGKMEVRMNLFCHITFRLASALMRRVALQFCCKTERPSPYTADCRVTIGILPLVGNNWKTQKNCPKISTAVSKRARNCQAKCRRGTLCIDNWKFRPTVNRCFMHLYAFQALYETALWTCRRTAWLVSIANGVYKTAWWLQLWTVHIVGMLCTTIVSRTYWIRQVLQCYRNKLRLYVDFI